MLSSEYDLGQFCEHIRNLNNQLDREEHLKKSNKSYRESLYQQEILTNQLVQTYKIITTSLIKTDSKFAKKKHDFNLIETHIEVCKLLVDLTSPYEQLFVNRRLIFDTLKKSCKNLEKKTPTSNNEKSDESSSQVRAKKRPLYDNDEYIKTLIETNINKFKDIFIKNNHFDELASSMTKLIDMYTNVCAQITKPIFVISPCTSSGTTANEKELNELKIFKDLILIDLILTLCLIRNLSLEKNESRLSLIISSLFERKIESNFIRILNMINLVDENDSKENPTKATVSDGTNVVIGDEKLKDINNSVWFVLNSLMCQVLCLFFSLANSKPKDVANNQEILQKCTDSLDNIGMNLCRHGAFANLIENMLFLLNKSSDLHIYFDISYFLWLFKFVLGNFVLNKSTCFVKKKNPAGYLDFFNNKESQSAIQLKKIIFSFDLLAFVSFNMLHNFEQLIFDSNVKNMARSMRHYHINQKSQENDLNNILFNNKIKSNLMQPGGKEYNMFSTVYQPSQSHTQFKEKSHRTPLASLPKVVNKNFLNILYLSINCLYEIMDCIQQHLIYVKTTDFKIKNQELITLDNIINSKDNIENQFEQETQFLVYLHEFLTFEDLKQSFSIIIRFYCYNEHVYTSSLVKAIMLTNEQFLKTFESISQYLKETELKDDIAEKDIDTDLDLSGTLDSSKSFTLVSTLIEKHKRIQDIYSLFCNADTSFMLQKLINDFEKNDNELNRCLVDFLDSLMNKSTKRRKLFNKNLSLALAKIASAENFHNLEQRTKNLISRMLMEIKNVCKHEPNLTNKILFDMHYLNSNESRNSRKQKKLESSPKAVSQLSNFTTTSTSSWSSLRSTSNKTRDSSSDSSLSHSPDDEVEDDAQSFLNEKAMLFSKNKSPKDISALIESEFVFCLNSLNAFAKTGCDKTINPNRMCNFIVKNDNLYRIFTYLVKLFESLNHKLTSWEIYAHLIKMKFHNDLIDNSFGKGLNLENTQYVYESEHLENKNKCFFKSKEYINLKVACSTEEFRKQLKDAYVKYLVEKLCTKSKRTRAAVYWMFNRLRRVKYYLLNKLDTSSILKNRRSLSTTDINVNLIAPSTFSLFEIKLLSFYHLNKLGIPFIPYAYEMQQVFHSVDFSHLLDTLGIARSSARFPYLPIEWLRDTYKLNDCLDLVEKCLCM